jgi:hypothetical protein
MSRILEIVLAWGLGVAIAALVNRRLRRARARRAEERELKRAAQTWAARGDHG